MTKSKWFLSIILPCLILFLLSPVLYGNDLQSDNNEDAPIIVKVVNTSKHNVMIHIMSTNIIVDTSNLESNKELELQVPVGHKVRVEYPTNPFKTDLSEVGSLNETHRVILLQDDGEKIFIQEKFSGKRLQGKRNSQGRPNVISTPIHPETETRVSDPDRPTTKSPIGITGAGSNHSGTGGGFTTGGQQFQNRKKVTKSAGSKSAEKEKKGGKTTTKK